MWTIRVRSFLGLPVTTVFLLQKRFLTAGHLVYLRPFPAAGYLGTAKNATVNVTTKTPYTFLKSILCPNNLSVDPSSFLAKFKAYIPTSTSSFLRYDYIYMQSKNP